MSKILGISAYYHDSAAALVVDGEVMSAMQEERFTRVKHDASFPTHAIRRVLTDSQLNLGDIDLVAYYEDNRLKVNRQLTTVVENGPRSFHALSSMMEQWAAGKLSKRRGLVDPLAALSGCKFPTSRIVNCDHHTSHASSAFFPSPFQEALVLTIDGVGEWATTRVSVGSGRALRSLDEIRFPHSLGLFYAAGTAHLGFKINSGEYKVMGLAPYGSPIYAEKLIEEVIDMKPDGSFRLNMEYFDYCVGMRMTNEKFADLVGIPPRSPEGQLTQNHMNLAASLQRATEQVLLNLVTAVHNRYGGENLCLAGGVALNCVANGRILREGGFKRVWIQPASGDAGNALGAALWAHHCYLGEPRTSSPDRDSMKGAFLGSCYTDEEIEAALRDKGVMYQRLPKDELSERVADDLANGAAMGWFQGRMEFGPRALGARSILADPRCPDMQRDLNLKTKFRESFRPFAPAVLAEKAADWFDLDTESPYMLLVAKIKAERIIPMTADEERLGGLEQLNVQRSSIPAVTHVDYSARVQTVHRETNPLFYELIARFSRKSGCDLLLNTSFNVRGEPIVESPLDAINCFMGTGLDGLAMGSFYLRRAWQPDLLRFDYRNRFQPD